VKDQATEDEGTRVFLSRTDEIDEMGTPVSSDEKDVFSDKVAILKPNEDLVEFQNVKYAQHTHDGDVEVCYKKGSEEVVEKIEGQIASTSNDTSVGPNILEDANETVGVRAEEYGPPTENFRCIADMWSGYLGIDLTPYDYSQMMILAKIGRTKTGDPDRDTHQDEAGYSLTTSLVHQDGSEPGEYHGGEE